MPKPIAVAAIITVGACIGAVGARVITKRYKTMDEADARTFYDKVRPYADMPWYRIHPVLGVVSSKNLDIAVEFGKKVRDQHAAAALRRAEAAETAEEDAVPTPLDLINDDVASHEATKPTADESEEQDVKPEPLPHEVLIDKAVKNVKDLHQRYQEDPEFQAQVQKIGQNAQSVLAALQNRRKSK